MKTRRYSLLTLALLLMVSVLNVRAQAPDAFYIYKNDGTTMPFFNDLVDSVKWSNYDLDGNYHRVAVVQEVYTTDSLYRIPVELIDSIGFHKPDNKYTADAVRMEQQPWWEYVTEYIDTLNVILLRQDVPESIMPKVGDKLVTVVQNDIFPGGFMGKVVHIEPNPEDGQQVVICDRLDFKDVFTEFTASAGFVAQDPATAAARAEAPQKRHINIDKTIHWPKVDFLGGSWGLQVGATWDLGDDKSKTLGGGITFGYEPDYDIELWVHYSIETGLEYQYKHRGTVNLKRTYNIQGTGSYHKDLDFGHYKWAIPNCPLLWWYVEPGVFVDASVTISLNWFTQQKYHDYVFVSYKEYEPDLNVYTARTWDETPAESSSASYSLSGSLSAGFYTEIGLRLPPAPRLEDNDAKYLMGRIQLGARIEGSTEVDIKEAIVKAFTDASVYRWLNNEASFAVTAFLSGELKLQTPFGGNFFYSLPFEVTASLGTKFGIVPSFDNVDVTTGKLDSIYYAICKSDVARNLIIPARNMGFTVRDGKGKTVSRVGNRFYWFSSFENMTDTIRGLEPGINYSLHPSFDFLGVIPMLGYPNKDFTVGELELDIKPQPIVATRERNVLRLPILTNARRTGVEVVEGNSWLHAVTDSLTLLVRTDSLPGNQPRSGKLMLKATTSDDTNELQIEVYVNQRTDRMIELEPQSLEFPALGGTKQVKATLMEPDRKLSVTGLPEWLKISISGTTINVTAEQNPDKNRTRTCTLIVLAEDKDGSRAERELKVTQQCDQPAIIVEPSVVEVPGCDPKLFTQKSGQGNYMTKTITLTYIRDNKGKDCVSSDDSWLGTNRYFKDYKDVGTDYYSCTTELVVYENPDTKNGREGTITARLQLNDNSFADAEVRVIQAPFVPVFEPDNGKITLMNEGTQYIGQSDYQMVNFTTNIPSSFCIKYECIPSDNWLQPNFTNPLEYSGGISAIANYDQEARSGTVTLRLELKDGTVIERVIYVTQKGTADDRKFNIDPARLEFPGAGGEKTLTVVPAQGVEIDRIWEVDCHTAGNSWLNGSGMNMTLIMTAEPNPDKVQRQRDFAVTVLLKDGTKVTENFIAYQKPAGIDLYPNTVQFDGLGGFKSVNIESSYEPVVITYDADWLEVERSGNGLFLTAQTNPGGHRSVIVYLSATDPNGKTVNSQLHVSQTSSTGYFRLEPSSFTFEGEGGTKQSNIFVGKEIKDQVTGDITASANDSWITCQVVDNGKNLKVTAAANPTAQQREGTVTIYCTLTNGTKLSATHKVTQKAGSAQPITLSISPTSLSFTEAGGSSNVSVTTTDAVNPIYIHTKTSDSWLHAPINGTTITVSTDANTTASLRTGTVTVTVSQNRQTTTQIISVSQSGKEHVETDLEITEINVFFEIAHTTEKLNNAGEVVSVRDDIWWAVEKGQSKYTFTTNIKVSPSSNGTIHVSADKSDGVEESSIEFDLSSKDLRTATVSNLIYKGKNRSTTFASDYYDFEIGATNIPYVTDVLGRCQYENETNNGMVLTNYVLNYVDGKRRDHLREGNHSAGVRIKTNISRQKDFSGYFLGEWHGGGNVLTLKSDGTYILQSGDSVRYGTFEVLQYRFDNATKTFKGSLSLSQLGAKKFEGHPAGMNIAGAWLAGMTFDGVSYTQDDGM